MQWTKRPQNFCPSCGYSWYPRGKNRSAQCPRCGGTAVDLPFEAFLRALTSLIMGLGALLRLLLELLGSLLRWLFMLLAPIVRGVIGLIALALRQVFFVVRFAVRWVASAWDDVQGAPNREVNPISLIAKLLVIVAVSSALIILQITFILSLTSPRR
jgi:hypothetical protein